MMKKILILMTVLFMMPGSVLAENIRGRLDYVSFADELIEVNGIKYDVNTELTRVVYHGEEMGEEDLREGDEVILVMDNASRSTARDKNGKRVLKTVIIVRGSKPGLES